MSASELLARLKHDLGKAISFQQRWLPDPEDEDALRSALVEDLLRTRRAGDRVTGAVDLWAALRSELVADPGLAEAEERVALDAEMAIVAAVGAALADGIASSSDLRRGAAAARRVTELCRGWWARHGS